MNNNKGLISIQTINKQQYVRRRIAVELLAMHMEGQQRIRAVKQYADDYGVGTGTVQGALQDLKDMGAIELNACGASGTFLVSANRRRLFEACGYGELICLMPLDANLQMRGLATGIYVSVSDKRLPIHILFARGSRNRIEMIAREKCDFAVMSRLAFDAAVRMGKDAVEMVETIGDYPGEMGCITRRGALFVQRETPVAFDRHSYDQLALCTELGLRQDAGCDYLDVQMKELVRQGRVEAALGRYQDLEPDLCFHPLEMPEETRRRLCQAVLVVRRGEDALAQLLRRIVRYDKVHAIQEKVVAGSRMVEY